MQKYLFMTDMAGLLFLLNTNMVELMCQNSNLEYTLYGLLLRQDTL